MVIPSETFIDRVNSVQTRTETPGQDPATSAGRVTLDRALGSSCDGCRFRATCLGHAFRASIAKTEPLVGFRRALAQGQVLYRSGVKCSSLYVVQAGFFKTVMLSEDGVAQVTGFQMPGDVLGIDGLSSGIHRSDAIALSQGCVCVVPRARLLQSSAVNEALERDLLGVLSNEIATDHCTMLLLGSRSAEERVAGFIVDLSERLSARGYSSCDLGLWMTREEIGSFLGLELETVSRVLSGLKKRHLLDVHRRHLHIRDVDALRGVVVGHETHAPPFRHATRSSEEATQ